MLSLTQAALFSGASLILIFTPGPDNIYVMTRGMTQGRAAALAAAAGFGLGNVFHTFCAVVGLSALLMSSAVAFQSVKFAGAIYLIYLGVRMLRSKEPIALQGGQVAQRFRVIFRQSVIANVLNPKVAVFFLAFFPQFIDKGRGHAEIQMLLLGGLFVVLTWIGFGLIALGAGWIGGYLQRQTGIAQRLGQVAGSVLVALGIRLAWPDRI